MYINFLLEFSGPLNQTFKLTFVEQHAGLVHIEPRSIDIAKDNKTYNILLVGQEPGSLMVNGVLNPNDTIR